MATNREHSLVDMYIYCILSIYISMYLWDSSDVFKFNKNGLKQPFEDCRRMKDSFIKKRTNKRRWDRSALGTKRFSSVLHLRLRSFSFLLYTVFLPSFLKKRQTGEKLKNKWHFPLPFFTDFFKAYIKKELKLYWKTLLYIYDANLGTRFYVYI